MFPPITRRDNEKFLKAVKRGCESGWHEYAEALVNAVDDTTKELTKERTAHQMETDRLKARAFDEIVAGELIRKAHAEQQQRASHLQSLLNEWGNIALMDQYKGIRENFGRLVTETLALHDHLPTKNDRTG